MPGSILVAGTILSGGGDDEFCGAISTVGLSGDVGCGFCACAEPAAKMRAEQNKRHFMMNLCWHSGAQRPVLGAGRSPVLVRMHHHRSAIAIDPVMIAS